MDLILDEKSIIISKSFELPECLLTKFRIISKREQHCCCNYENLIYNSEIVLSNHNYNKFLIQF